MPKIPERRLRLYTGDCLKILPRLGPVVDLAFADPPFNTGYPYDVYDDRKTKEEYLHWCDQWIRAVRMCLKPTASFYLASGLSYQAELKLIAENAGLHWRDTICWHYTFGPRQEKRWTPSWVAIHYFTMGETWTWNPEIIRVPSARQMKYNDRRAKAGGKVPDNVWTTKESRSGGSSRESSLSSSSSPETKFFENGSEEPSMKSTQPTGSSEPWLLPGSNSYQDKFGSSENCWLESRICGTFKERTGHPCQMPEAVLSRIILASSNPGDLVLDPLLGSGTTAAAALKIGRRCIGIELSEPYTQIIRERLAEL